MRYYEPHNGRFLTQDAFPGLAADPTTQHPSFGSGQAAYAYVGNNPVNPSAALRTGWVNPSGNFAIAPILGAVGAGDLIGGLMGAGGYLLGAVKGGDFSWGGGSTEPSA
jgi:hypothetical protein